MIINQKNTSAKKLKQSLIGFKIFNILSIKLIIIKIIHTIVTAMTQ